MAELFSRFLRDAVLRAIQKSLPQQNLHLSSKANVVQIDVVKEREPVQADSPSYDRIGEGYAVGRKGEPRIFAQLRRSLGNIKSLLNVGAGSGSYEPPDLEVTAVEPSAEMIAQRPAASAPVVQAAAEALPFPDKHFDASMALLTIHHWDNVAKGLREMRRVSRERVLLMTFAPETRCEFWLWDDYFPEFRREDEEIFPTLQELSEHLGQGLHSEPIMIPHDIQDGFLGAYWRRPDSYLDPQLRKGISSFSKRSELELQEGLARLQEDLSSGAWQRKHGACMARESVDLGYRMVVSSC